MHTYDQTNIKNNIIYFTLWRVKYLKYGQWDWEARYNQLARVNPIESWTHSCIKKGAINVSTKWAKCPFCGASKLNEPSEEAIHDYMELNYDS